MDLAGLNWSGDSFYYKAQLKSDSNQLYTPILDEISIGYNVTYPVRLRNIRLRNIRAR